MNLIQNSFEQGKKSQPFRLCWTHEKGSIPAGVAFYDENFGEYRLKIDIQPETIFYLKPISWEEERAQYRVEVVIKRGGVFRYRRQVGRGYSSKLENAESIVMEIGPYSKPLVLSLEEKGDKSHE